MKFALNALAALSLALSLAACSSSSTPHVKPTPRVSPPFVAPSITPPAPTALSDHCLVGHWTLLKATFTNPTSSGLKGTTMHISALSAMVVSYDASQPLVAGSTSTVFRGSATYFVYIPHGLFSPTSLSSALTVDGHLASSSPNLFPTSMHYTCAASSLLITTEPNSPINAGSSLSFSRSS